MATGIYVGIGGKARKVSKAYVGVGGVAHTIKKGYVGDSNGKARLFFNGGKTIINFYIFGSDEVTKTYQAEEGMTWAKWVNSSYNTVGWYVASDGNTIRYDGPDGSESIEGVSSRDNIIPDHSYDSAVEMF